MSENRVMRINRPNIWSRTRRQLLHQCPRAWILKYGFKRANRTFNRNLQRISDWSSPYRMMQRAVRSIVIQRLEAHKHGIAWIEQDLASKIRNMILGKRFRQNRTLELIEKRIGKSSQLKFRIPNSEINRLIEIACLRYHSIIKNPIISKILNDEILQWHSFSRLDYTKLNGNILHISPDIIWKNGTNWNLMRFSVQGSGKQISIENMAMLHWAVTKRGLPSNPKRFTIHELNWSRGKWNWKTKKGDERLERDSINLIKMDLKAMEDLHRKLGPASDLSQIPLARNEKFCKTCGHRDTCPGGEDLTRANLEQSALEMFKSSNLRN